MKIYLMRHGHSPMASEARVASDAERPLSEAGRKGASANTQRLMRLGGKPALILHSPLRRAAETAQEAAKALGGQTVLREFPALANILSAGELLRALRGFKEELLLVGHQPQLGELASLLSNRPFDLKPGGIIALETTPGQESAIVLWSANPEDLEP